MKYRHFLFDLDDTLLDFGASERLSFATMLQSFGGEPGPALFADYQRENAQLWTQFERGAIGKDALKVERFRRVFDLHALAIDPAAASARYLESLAETVVLVDGARALCEALAQVGEVGIITNGIEYVQSKRIGSSGLGDWIAFVSTSEACGHAKPDARFFEYAVRNFRGYDRSATVIVGDRLDADILGANRFGIDSCWYNPLRLDNPGEATPTYEVSHLDQIVARLTG
ncbi:YjjG family noncanonical pyrimidine nucleotidase [Lysobacter enzymogenes]|uniref:YjjG family noncanonical pyrimidine nucleotidase n=1 Tax=Lysobacter enzymogenes TaxID=69 RepID=UPI00384B169E